MITTIEVSTWQGNEKKIKRKYLILGLWRENKEKIT